MPNELRPRITVVGVGGAGGNAVNNMIRAELEGVEFMVANTDSQALTGSLCDRRIQLGSHVTQGLGAGSRPDIGRAAAEEVLDEIIGQLSGSNMVFITAGMGGGTGTGAAPVIARAAREHGILTIGVVTKPFHFEGLHRMRLAESGSSSSTRSSSSRTRTCSGWPTRRRPSRTPSRWPTTCSIRACAASPT
jgi:cell division protein FtsZ